MFSQLDKEGLYDQTQRYRFTNIDDEDFTGSWDGRPYVTVPSGESVTLPESQAINFAKQLCTRVMVKDEKRRFVPNMAEPIYEMSQRSRVGVPMARKPFEDRILQRIEQGEETPEIQALRSQMREEIIADMHATESTEPPKGPSSIADLAVVDDPSRPARKGKEFEGVTTLK